MIFFTLKKPKMTKGALLGLTSLALSAAGTFIGMKADEVGSEDEVNAIADAVLTKIALMTAESENNK